MDTFESTGDVVKKNTTVFINTSSTSYLQSWLHVLLKLLSLCYTLKHLSAGNFLVKTIFSNQQCIRRTRYSHVEWREKNDEENIARRVTLFLELVSVLAENKLSWNGAACNMVILLNLFVITSVAISFLRETCLATHLLQASFSLYFQQKVSARGFYFNIQLQPICQ